MRVQKYGFFTFPPRNPGTFFNIFLTKGPDSGQKWSIGRCNPRVYIGIKILILFSPQTGHLPSLYPDCTPRRRQSVRRNPIQTELSPGATGLRPGKTGLRRVPAIIMRRKSISPPFSFISKEQGGQTNEKRRFPMGVFSKNIKETTKRNGEASSQWEASPFRSLRFFFQLLQLFAVRKSISYLFANLVVRIVERVESNRSHLLNINMAFSIQAPFVYAHVYDFAA